MEKSGVFLNKAKSGVFVGMEKSGVFLNKAIKWGFCR
jgi:hypothetical protein